MRFTYDEESKHIKLTYSINTPDTNGKIKERCLAARSGRQVWIGGCSKKGSLAQQWTFNNGMIVSEQTKKCVVTKPYGAINDDGTYDVISNENEDMTMNEFFRLTDKKRYVVNLAACAYNGFGEVEVDEVL